jgi:CubicO group peptidase (beta-lactamase class C family)
MMVVKYLVLGLFVVAAAGVCFADDAPPTDAQIRAELQKCVEQQNRTPGIVVGVIDDKGTHVVAYGKRERGRPEPVDGDSIFEIGSITKVFTTTLFQQMIERGEVKLDDPIGKYLPATVKTPSYKGSEITLVDLATQASALPSMPTNFSPQSFDDPWADYTIAQMYDFLSHCKLARKPGMKFEYSNLGMGLLAHILTLRAGTNYEALVIRRICDPLGMTNTRITFSPEMKARLARGHSTVGPPVKNWNFAAIEGAGALRSSVNDMLKFLAANMGRGSSPLNATLAAAHQPRHSAGWGMKIGLGWLTFSLFGVDYTWHNGGTGGYRTFLGFSKEGRGAIVMANEANDVDDVGRYLLWPDVYSGVDKFKAPPQHTVAPTDPNTFDRYTGQYQGNDDEVYTVWRDGAHLIAKESGTMEFPAELFPEAEGKFFFTSVDAQMVFETNAAGAVTGFVSRQDGKTTKARKIK